uniref:Putative wd40 domain protein n=1 Tax=Xenopsylla cheopis TaxID=163159 RepID=A0A6M2DNG7_XENCH
MENINFVPCVCFVKRGVAKTNPDKVQLTKEELAEIINKAKEEIDDKSENENSDAEMATDENKENGTTTMEDEFKLEDYDKNKELPSSVLGIGSIALIGDAETESYFNKRDRDDDVDDSDSEAEDDIIKSDDNLILVGHVEGDSSILEVYIYNENEGSLYVHHDLLLPTFPLCIEWLDYDPSNPKPGNLCAIGTMDTEIEIWDLDIIDCLEPAFKLGSKKKKYGHKDAVLDLAWNKNYHHIMASGSADKTVKLWDIDTCKVHTTFSHATDKIQTLCWHLLEHQTLLVGSCDGYARIYDCTQANGTHKSWKVSGEIEKTEWDAQNPFCFGASTNEGEVYYIDCRVENPIWQIKAHNKEVTGLSISQVCPGLLITASSDNIVKTWDTKNGTPQLISEKDMKIGDIQGMTVCPENTFVIACGGDNKSNNFGVWDLRNEERVQNVFGSRNLVVISG